MVVIGLILPWISILLNPSQAIWITRCIIFFIACFAVGTKIWPEGISGCRVLEHVKTARQLIEDRRNPIGFLRRNLIAGLIASAILLGGGEVIVRAVKFALQKRSEIQFVPETWMWIAADLCIGAGLLALGVWRARYHMKRKDEYLAKAEDYVREIYEMKREELFEKQSPK